MLSKNYNSSVAPVLCSKKGENMTKYTPKKKQNLRRIRRFIKSAEKRGFVFSSDLKENLSSYSTQKLKALTPQKLYKQATYSIGGETISGERGRKIERTISAKKAVETKRIRKEYREQKEWERIHRDEIENISISDYEGYLPSYSTIVLEEIKSLIKQYATSKSEVRSSIGDYLLELLDAQIRNYGEEVVAKACEEAPDEIKATIESIIFESKDDRRRDKIAQFVQLITGVIPTIEESKEFTELAEDYEVFNNV